MTHPYFVAKARDFMRRAGAAPDVDITGIARWAQIAYLANQAGYSRARRRGIIIGQDGSVLAETRRVGRRRGLVRHADRPDLKRITGQDGPTEVGLAMGAIRRATGLPVVHADYSDLCEGHLHR